MRGEREGPYRWNDQRKILPFPFLFLRLLLLHFLRRPSQPSRAFTLSLSLSLPASSRAFSLHPPSREANRIRNKTSHLEIYETNEDLTYTVKLDLRLSISHSAFSFPISPPLPPSLSLSLTLRHSHSFSLSTLSFSLSPSFFSRPPFHTVPLHLRPRFSLPFSRFSSLFLSRSAETSLPFWFDSSERDKERRNG